MSKYPLDTKVKCWVTDLKVIELRNSETITKEKVTLIVPIDESCFMVNLSSWIDGYFPDLSLDEINEKFILESRVFLYTKKELMDDLLEEWYSEIDIDMAINYQKEMWED